ncbi:hypothetical protein B566_EDAN008023 [Ephemera danica]|nr:hypothetical protein B566_EDAN008023 [Ephemera danica]
MSTMTFGQKKFTATPPEKGSFPLDHDGECKREMLLYMACLRKGKNENTQCREEWCTHLFGFPSIGNFWSNLLDTDNSMHVIKRRIVGDTVVEGDLVLVCLSQFVSSDATSKTEKELQLKVKISDVYLMYRTASPKSAMAHSPFRLTRMFLLLMSL